MMFRHSWSFVWTGDVYIWCVQSIYSTHTAHIPVCARIGVPYTCFDQDWSSSGSSYTKEGTTEDLHKTLGVMWLPSVDIHTYTQQSTTSVAVSLYVYYL